MSKIGVKDARNAPFVYYDVELDDAGLDVWQHRTYCRIARRCAGNDHGECWESLEQMAAQMQMSRPTLVRALKVLIQRAMIQRISRAGNTSVYALLDKSKWVSFDACVKAQKAAEAGKPENHPLVNQRTTPSKPENHPVVTTEPPPGKPESQGVVHTFTTKKTHEENTEESKDVERAGARATGPPPLVNHSDAFTVNGHGLAVDHDAAGAEWTPLQAALASACLWDRATASQPRVQKIAEAERLLLSAHPQPDLAIVREARNYYLAHKKLKFQPGWIAQDYALIREWCDLLRPKRSAPPAEPGLCETDDARAASCISLIEGYFAAGVPPRQTIDYLCEWQAQLVNNPARTPGEGRVLACLNEVLTESQRAA